MEEKTKKTPRKMALRSYRLRDKDTIKIYTEMTKMEMEKINMYAEKLRKTTDSF